MILCLELTAAIIAARRQSERAAWLLGIIERQRTVIGACRSVYEQDKNIQILDAARTALGEEAFLKEFERGRAANFEEAVDRALRIIEDEINYPKEKSL